MTGSLNRSQPAVTPNYCTSRVVPAATVWEPAEGSAGAGRTPEVRRLSPVIRTHQPAPGELFSRPEVSSGTPQKRQIGETTQAYLVGGLFGLSLVIGTVLAGPVEDPVTATSTEHSVVSTR